MELLQSVIAYLSSYVEHTIQHTSTCNCRQTMHQVVQISSVVAAYKRFDEGRGLRAALERPLARGATSST